MASDRRDRVRVQERAQRGQALERAVGVPQLVARFVHALAARLAPDLSLDVQVGDVGELAAVAARRCLRIERALLLDRAEPRRERDMLLLRELLTGKDRGPSTSRRPARISSKSASASGFVRSTSPTSAAKLGVTGTMVMLMTPPPVVHRSVVTVHILHRLPMRRCKGSSIARTRRQWAFRPSCRLHGRSG